MHDLEYLTGYSYPQPMREYTTTLECSWIVASCYYWFGGRIFINCYYDYDRNSIMEKMGYQWCIRMARKLYHNKTLEGLFALVKHKRYECRKSFQGNLFLSFPKRISCWGSIPIHYLASNAFFFFNYYVLLFVRNILRNTIMDCYSCTHS